MDRKRAAAILAVSLAALACSDATGLKDADASARSGSVSIGPLDACYVTPAGIAFCWGRDNAGTLGAAVGHACGSRFITCTSVPVAVAPNIRFRMISNGETSSCGISVEGPTYCWGTGYLGDGKITSHVFGTGPSGIDLAPSFIRVGTNDKLTGITVGGGSSGAYACGITSARHVLCWGAPLTGFPIAGNDGPEVAPVPIPSAVPGDPGLVSISLNEQNACGVTADGRAFCWGSNARGQLASSLPLNSCVFDRGSLGIPCSGRPIPVETTTRFTAVAPGRVFACGLAVAGTAYCWGEGYGAVPKEISNIKFRQLSVGQTHACGVTTTDDAFCWGRDASGELGTGNRAFDLWPAPNAVVGGRKFSSVVAGGQSNFERSCGVTLDGSVYCWGSHVDGALGVGDGLSLPCNPWCHSPLPVRLAFPNEATATVALAARE